MDQNVSKDNELSEECIACAHCHEVGYPGKSKYICDLNIKNPETEKEIKCPHDEDEF